MKVYQKNPVDHAELICVPWGMSLGDLELLISVENQAVLNAVPLLQCENTVSARQTCLRKKTLMQRGIIERAMI